jgi:hypothetical protein
LQEIEKCFVGVASDGIKLLLNFIKIGLLVGDEVEGGHHTQHGDLVSTKGNRLKTFRSEGDIENFIRIVMFAVGLWPGGD